MDYTSTHPLFRSLTAAEVETFQQFARDNKPGMHIDIYHPVCRAEWQRLGKLTITIEKAWDSNERIREVGNRVYVSAGRWQWHVLVNGELESVHDLKREAVARRAELLDI